MHRRQKKRGKKGRSRAPQADVRLKAASGSSGLALALERLEARQMLAITVTDQNLAGFKVGADYVFEDDSSITVAND